MARSQRIQRRPRILRTIGSLSICHSLANSGLVDSPLTIPSSSYKPSTPPISPVKRLPSYPELDRERIVLCTSRDKFLGLGMKFVWDNQLDDRVWKCKHRQDQRYVGDTLELSLPVEILPNGSVRIHRLLASYLGLKRRLFHLSQRIPPLIQFRATEWIIPMMSLPLDFMEMLYKRTLVLALMVPCGRMINLAEPVSVSCLELSQ
jgi:hypothetical protein